MRTVKLNYSVTLTLIASLTLSLSVSSMAAQDVWIGKAAMPTPRMWLGVGVLEGKIYAVGGSPAPHYSLTAVEMYDPATNTWTKKASLPAGKGEGLGVSMVDGRIYAIGGYGDLDGTLQYDPTTDTWTRKANMPTARKLLTSSVVNGKIYAIGGATDFSGPAFKTVEEYDPSTDTWQRKADLPEPRYLHAAAVAEGKIYVFGGAWQAWTKSKAVFAYDPITDTWERKADVPAGRAGLSASVAGGKIYVLGGDRDPAIANVEEYDFLSDTWRTRADMPTARSASASASLGSRIYVIGGTVTSTNASSITHEYDPNPLAGDFDDDGVINLKDFAILAGYWSLNERFVDLAPWPHSDQLVNVMDLAAFASRYTGLLAHWKLDGDFAFSFDRYPGSGVGDPLFVEAEQARVGSSAVELDGDDFIKVVDFHGVAGTSPRTCSAWIKTTQAVAPILSWGDGNMAGGLWDVRVNSLGQLRLIAGGGITADGVTAINIGQWVHVAAVLPPGGDNAEDILLYVNGVLDRGLVTPGTINTKAETGMWIGAVETGRCFTGLIDDLRVYNHALTSAEIWALANK